jgi:glutamate/tyrosine decarboxylase-like PLP-dependent enzyme
MDVHALSRVIAEDRSRGDLPFCVVAQIGSINVGAIDPLDEIADVCAEHGLWLHGDGACGLMAAVLPEMRALCRGLERADSLAFDPHKWLGVPYDCGVVLIRQKEQLRRAFSITAPYLRADLETEQRTGMDFLEYGPEMSRGFRALKLWMTLRFYGTRALRDSFAKSVQLAQYLHQLVQEHPDFEVIHEPKLYLYCFRFAPSSLAPRADEARVQERLDQLNQEIAEAVQRSGVALVMTSRIHGRVVLRMSICSQRTEQEDIRITFEALAKAGQELASLIAV